MVEERFARGPFVHPFRHPSIHATNHNRRLLWVAAHDKILTSNINVAKYKEELRKERWLECHDRQRAGIPGLLRL
eukprot:9413162-Karenia_brevis.AAC.1